MSSNKVYDAAVEAQRLFEQQGWKNCIIGGLAVIRWGQPRATQDVDFSLLTGIGDEEAYIDTVLARFRPRISDARQFAIDSRVLLLAATNGVALDVALAAFPYEQRVIQRASPFAFAPDAILVTASAEDLLTLKAFAGRDRDWGDARGIVERQADLDWKQIDRELTDLCELRDDQSPVARLAAIRREVAQNRGT